MSQLTLPLADLEEQQQFPPWQAIVLVFACALFTGVLAWYELTSFANYAVPGFDTSIFSQGTYLLSRFEEPFVTIRGLNIFGDHSSFILILLAPLYWLWDDPRVLLLAQAVALPVPAIVAYALATPKLGRNVALAVSLAYLSMPAVQWIGIFHFHPEGLATAFLAIALWAFFREKGRLLFAFLFLAILCKEDVSFVIFALGIVMYFEGKKRWGIATSLFSLGYFVMVTFVAMPLINGRNNLYFQRNYGVEVEGAGALFKAVPAVFWNGLQNLTADEGLVYLALMLGPVLFLPLLRARWLLPVCPPLILNFASLIPYQHQITYQYLATSVPFIAIATVEGLKQLRLARPLGLVMAAVLLVAATLVWTNGPKDRLESTQKDTNASHLLLLDRAVALIPPDAAVSATYNLNAHLLSRKYIYEYPNPFKTANWAFGEDLPHEEEAVEAVEYVVVQTSNLSDESLEILERLRNAPNWVVLSQEDEVVVLMKIAPNEESLLTGEPTQQ